MLAALDEHFPADVTLDASGGRLLRLGDAARASGHQGAAGRGGRARRHVRAGRRLLPGRPRRATACGWRSATSRPSRSREGVRRLAEVLEDKLELYRAFVAAGALPAADARGRVEGGVAVKEKIAVLMGGRSLEREVSLAQRRARLRRARASSATARWRSTSRPTWSRRCAARSRTPSTSRCTASSARTARCRRRSSSSASPTPVPASSRRALAWDKSLSKRLFAEAGDPDAAVGDVHVRRVQGDGRGERARPRARTRSAASPSCVKPVEAGLGARPREGRGRRRPARRAARRRSSLRRRRRSSRSGSTGASSRSPSSDGPTAPEVLPPVEMVAKSGVFDYTAAVHARARPTTTAPRASTPTVDARGARARRADATRCSDAAT